MKLKLNSQHAARGFTTVEVLIGILLTIIFMGVAMQMIVVSAALRVKAQEASESANWVEADLTVIRTQAEALGSYDPIAKTYDNIDSERCNATSENDGYAALLQAAEDNSNENGAADAEIGDDDTDSKSSAIGSRPYTLRRRTTLSTTNVHSLRIQYDVYEGTDTTEDPIYTYYTEVIPSVAFSCKQI
jgi:type II secretory pathway pseudopilin PulG